jgi:hypothetical protein
MRLNWSNVVGRPGLDPGTLGPPQDSSPEYVTISLNSSGVVSKSLPIAEILTSSTVWLQVWLQPHSGITAEVVVEGDRRRPRVQVRLVEPPLGT